MSNNDKIRRGKLMSRDPHCWFCGVRVHEGHTFSYTRAVLYQLLPEEKLKRGQSSSPKILICFYCCRNMQAWRSRLKKNREEGWEPEYAYNQTQFRRMQRMRLLHEDPHCWYCGVEVKDTH